MHEKTEEPVVPQGIPHHDLMELFYVMPLRKVVRRVILGLRAPHDSGEYKFARLQILRLWAPVSAIAVPLLVVGAMFVLSGVENEVDRVVDLQIMEPERLEQKLDEIQEIEQILPPEDLNQEFITSDEAAPSSGLTGPSGPPGPPGPPGPGVGPDVPFSPQPAAFDSVAMVRSPVTMKGIYASRNPGARGSAIAKYGGGGGGGGSEGTVYLALRWLKKNQGADGSWTTATGGSASEQNGAAPAMTGLALLAYLAHGEMPASDEFGPTVEKAIKWLLANQTEDGRFKQSDGNGYSLPIAAYALCEAYTLTKIPMLMDAAVKSTKTIVNGQNAGLLWNYNCDRSADRNDMSYSGWCMQALRAASLAGLEIPGLKDCMAKAVQGCKLSFVPLTEGQGGNFSYARVGRAPGDRNAGLTGVGVLCMQLLGGGKDGAAVKGLQFLDTATCKWDEPWGTSPIYYWYYATQAKFHAGGTTWKNWNSQFAPALNKNIIVIPKAIQDPKGEWKDIGYWEPAGKKAADGKVASGEVCKSYVYNTTLCALMLEVYYRYLPSYKPPEDTYKEATFDDKGKDIDVRIK